jgi:hypothetical protein
MKVFNAREFVALVTRTCVISGLLSHRFVTFIYIESYIVYMYIYVYIYIYKCVCVCVYLCLLEGIQYNFHRCENVSSLKFASPYS